MSKKLIITEEEKRDIKSLYSVNEQFEFDKIIDYLKDVLKNKDKYFDKFKNTKNNLSTLPLFTKTTSDDDFYKKILYCVGAKPTKDNMSFMYAWRQSEGGKATNNPFNTTQKMDGATNYNSVGVKNYRTPEDGIQSTCKTLNNGRYNDIVNGLKNDVGLFELSRMEGLKTWGTRELLAKVVDGYLKGASPKPPAIA